MTDERVTSNVLVETFTWWLCRYEWVRTKDVLTSTRRPLYPTLQFLFRVNFVDRLIISSVYRLRDPSSKTEGVSVWREYLTQLSVFDETGSRSSSVHKIPFIEMTVSIKRGDVVPRLTQEWTFWTELLTYSYIHSVFTNLVADRVSFVGQVQSSVIIIIYRTNRWSFSTQTWTSEWSKLLNPFQGL